MRRKKILAMLTVFCICICLCISSLTVPVIAADNATIQLTVDKKYVESGDIVVVTITSRDMIVSGWGGYLEYEASKLECVSVKGGREGVKWENDGYLYNSDDSVWEKLMLFEGVEDTQRDGCHSFGFVAIEDASYAAGIVSVIEFKAKEAGKVSFVLNEDSSGFDGNKTIAAKETVTIGSESEIRSEEISLDEEASELPVEAPDSSTDGLPSEDAPDYPVVGNNPFVDVADDVYYTDAVLWAVENNITSGTSANTFSPDAVCTRAQVVTFLWRAAGSPAPLTTGMPFTDVEAGAYYAAAVQWAVENNITAGTSATTFDPNGKCTRAQIVTFLWRAQGNPAAAAVNSFVDVEADAYYAAPVLWAVANGITNGTSATTFGPAADCTRAQVVTFLYRCMAE